MWRVVAMGLNDILSTGGSLPSLRILCNYAHVSLLSPNSRSLGVQSDPD